MKEPSAFHVELDSNALNENAVSNPPNLKQRRAEQTAQWKARQRARVAQIREEEKTVEAIMARLKRARARRRAKRSVPE
jgi:hypothetical protein